MNLNSDRQQQAKTTLVFQSLKPLFTILVYNCSSSNYCLNVHTNFAVTMDAYGLFFLVVTYFTVKSITFSPFVYLTVILWAWESSYIVK